MSKRLQSVINAYLSNTQVKEPVLGGSDGHAEVIEAEVHSTQWQQQESDAIFIGRLQSFLQFNRNLIVTVYAIIIAVVIFLGVLIWFQKSNLTFVVGLLGGQGAGIYFGITKMHQIYKENFVARIILNMVPRAADKEEKDKLLQMMKDFMEK